MSLDYKFDDGFERFAAYFVVGILTLGALAFLLAIGMGQFFHMILVAVGATVSIVVVGAIILHTVKLVQLILKRIRK